LDIGRHRFCRLSELRATKQITRWVDELRDELTALVLDGELVVFSSVCPHFGGEFDFSQVASGKLVCKWHAWSFDARSGECLKYRLRTRLRHYSFHVDEETDGLYVHVR
jgi:nitrite reductase/ring-hydroxylating ferredoxin subunit